jgi:hypothetical protein
MMKLNDLLILIPAVQNGWTFAAFVVGAGLLCYCHLRRGRRR